MMPQLVARNKDSPYGEASQSPELLSSDLY
jgi:hypothetical protein